MKNKYITKRERVELETMLKLGVSKQECADRLGKSLKTIYNEIERGTVELLSTELIPYKIYQADVAQRKYDENKRNKGVSLKSFSNQKYLDFLADMIVKKKYSPYAIVQYMKNNNISFGCDLCERSIYNYAYHGYIRVKREQMLAPRHTRQQQTIQEKVNYNLMKYPTIENRPECANNRGEFGHWEIDTVYSGKNTSKTCLLTLTERQTRIEESYLIPDRTAKSIVNIFNQLEKEMGYNAFTRRYKTLTSDNGVEFKDFIGVCISPYTGQKRTEQYFAHPYSSFERGTNENHNRMIRRFIPKGTDLLTVTQEQLNEIVEYINNYPRRMFGGLSSKQFYEQFVKV